MLKGKRLLSLFLAFVLVVGLLPPVQAAVVDTVYLDPANGADTNAGTEAAPVKTLAAAYGKLTQGGTVVFLSNLTWSTSGYFPACDYPVTLTSKTGAEGIVASANLRMQADTTFKNITLTFNNTGMMILSGEGHNLTVESDVTVVRNTTAQLNITAAPRYGSTVTASPTLTVKAGTWNHMYGVHGIGITGDVNVVIDGANFSYISPCYNGVITGNLNVTVKNSTIASVNLGPTHKDGKVTGNLNITLGDNAKVTKTAAPSGTVQGVATVEVRGADQQIGTLTGYGTGSKLVLRSGVCGAASGFAATEINVAAGETLTLDGAVTATTVTCAGTLNFTENGSLTATTVNGTVNCTVTGDLLANKAIVTAPAASDIKFPEETGVVGMNGKWMVLDKDNFKGLIVKAESDVTMVFYKNHTREAADKIQPDFTETVDGYTYYYFSGISGYYCYDATRAGDYKIYQRLYVTAEERDAGHIEEVVMQKKANPSQSEWDHTYYYGQVDEFIDKAENDMTEKWHTEVELVTPVFTNPNKPAQQMTTQPELEAFIQGLDDENDNMYIFSIGKSATYGFDIPIVFFTKTDLSGCTTLEEVAAALKADGLPNIGYKAQMHGDEHAAGEGALNVIYQLDKEENANLLDTINIYVMPRINPDGAYVCQRNLRAASMLFEGFSGNKDPNRHNLTLAYHEVRLYVNTVRLFDPVAELDGHERQRGSNVADNQIGTSWRYGSSQDMLELQVDLVQSMFTALADVDLSGAWYSDRVNCVPGNNTRSYAAAQSRIHLLMETRGIYLGLENYGSRTASHVVSAMAYLKYCAENVDQMIAVSNAQRQALVENGKTYEETDTIILNSAEVLHPEYDVITEKFNFANGNISSDYKQPACIMEATATRVAPTAYVIPKGMPREAEILELLQLQEIDYYELPANTAISLQQYSGTVSAALTTTGVSLSSEQMFAFPEGCYVMEMDQVNSYVLALLMEPDNAAYDLVEQGRIPANEDGTLPIYRYIKNLTDDEIGIEYTTAAAAPTGLTATTATSAANDGTISGLDATKLYEYKLAGEDAYIQVAAGSTAITGLVPGTYYVRFQATDTIGMDAVVTIGCNATVYLSAANGDDTNAGTTEAAALKTIEAAYAKLNAILGTSGDASTGTIVLVDDYTITSDARVDLPSHSYPLTITGKTQSVRLIFNPTVMEEAQQQLAFHGDTTLDNLTFRAASTKKYDYIFACGNKLTINANVKCSSARSSTFPYLVAGDYKTTVVNTDLTVLGGRWQSVYATGFRASHTGLAKLNIDGTNVTLNSAIRTTYSGTPSGDTEITLANVAASTVYLGTFYSGNISGDVTLYLKENVTGTFYTGARRSGNVTGTVTIVADGVDLNEVNFVNGPGADNTSGTVTKAVLCYASGDAIPVEGFDEIHIDTDTTVSLVSDLEVAMISGGGVVELNGYKLTGESKYAITADVKTVSLRANAAGLYFTGDFDVADELEATYGIALSTEDETPVARDNTTSLYTVGETSVLVKDIMKAGNADNASNARMKIYARAYAKLSDGTIIYGDTATVTLQQVVMAADSKWSVLTQAQQQSLLELYAAFSAEMAGWKIPNIKANA
ncbi:MAG: hypothetical protein IKA47_00575 [Oscillospiraceae bacterium]|nr:hypothetical protein [Oscillospiraceae bacterium]